ncbi:ABC transporter substrate-binding protein [Methanonatronarchaeum sp. AMET-Sl]|uniref:ABC transporter substrate-binding protein n=1 Tax=Methanonatronarchaeum sp. AMET-Sl TaxID=3037654 RepID=UPI00244D9B38|nr:ABC transporter substrate-binding protein [Methanonatronarchaeum sp. AMET-Sl]WGI17325.1 ABC transporter substrate-binding protein [Methanonatronarchaeum sp. AMET-Sl]
MKKLRKLSRRDFIKLTGGVAAVATVGGCIDGIIPDTDVQLIVRSPPQMVEELGVNSIDGFMAWEPFNAEAVVSGYGNIIMESGEIWPNHPCCVMAYNKEWFDENDDSENILKRIAWVQVKSTRWINEALDEDSDEYDEVVDLSRDFTDRGEEVVEKAFGPIKFEYELNKDGTQRYIEDLEEYQIFDFARWNEVGYEDAEEYAEDIIENEYIEWAIENIELSAEEVVEETGGEYGYEINIGHLENDLHQLAYIVASEKGFFEAVGLTIDEPSIYPNGAELMRSGFGDNDIDIGYLGTTPALIHRINTPGCEIGIFTGVNEEGSAIVAKEGIEEIEDFAEIEDAVYATPGEGTMQEFMSIRVFDDAGLTL